MMHSATFDLLPWVLMGRSVEDGVALMVELSCLLCFALWERKRCRKNHLERVRVKIFGVL